ncbi:hypothetical protein Syun_002288 [Stephania yunnanensis]|uniref:non-specific serine/threonine protein kinase n=1 Tax=Stephania yunnanensis TaxID=152371 RepID=A0AAP0LGB7_9MAGN
MIQLLEAKTTRGAQLETGKTGQSMIVFASLSTHGSKRSTSLDWAMRRDIILGIARGVLYLHQDSGLKIVHRDLKASNVR